MQEAEEQRIEWYAGHGWHQWQATHTCWFTEQQDFLNNTWLGIQKYLDVRWFISPFRRLDYVFFFFLIDCFVVVLSLIGNPVCDTALRNTNYCQLQQQSAKPYSTSLANCGRKSCPADQKVSPQSCDCAYPYEGTFYFRGPSFRELSNDNTFHSLEMSLWVKLDLTPGSVSLQNPFFNIDDYLQVQLELFPPTGKYFNRSEVVRIGFSLSNQTYKPPPEFGPYYFIASPYTFQGIITEFFL